MLPINLNINNANPYAGLFSSPFANPPPVVTPPQKHPLRAIQFSADFSGCGLWRMYFPSMILQHCHDYIITDSTVMIRDENFFRGVKSVRIQRQASPHQMQYIKYVREICDKFDINLIYEVDDIIFREDIPDYNKFKTAFDNSEIRQTAEEIIKMCNEMTVTCDFMREYYKSKTKLKNVTVIPNYPPRWWMGNYYDEQKLLKRWLRNRKQPRVLYPGSAAHFDVDSRVKYQDDFFHVNEAVIRTRKQFKWVFIGSYPFACKPYIESGEMEFRQWSDFYNYPRIVDEAEVNAIIAPLCDNTFNRAKSDIKYIEACCFGLPAICQDLDTYKNAVYKFKTGDEMIAHLESIFKYQDNYLKICKTSRKVGESRFMENPENIGQYKELLTFKPDSIERKLLKRNNP